MTKVKLGEDVEASTMMDWMKVDGVVVPARFVTYFTPAAGPLGGFETTFYNHKVNGDLSGIELSRFEGSVSASVEEEEEGEALFEGLYHGFADEAIIAPIVDSSGTYERIKFTFSLYVEDPAIVRELDRRHEEIREFVKSKMAGREWSGEEGLCTAKGKWRCGEEIRKALNEYLGTESVTDFYFLEFVPLESGS